MDVPFDSNISLSKTKVLKPILLIAIKITKSSLENYFLYLIHAPIEKETFLLWQFLSSILETLNQFYFMKLNFREISWNKWFKKWNPRGKFIFSIRENLGIYIRNIDGLCAQWYFFFFSKCFQVFYPSDLKSRPKIFWCTAWKGLRKLNLWSYKIDNSGYYTEGTKNSLSLL